jgi:hypothetical protein
MMNTARFFALSLIIWMLGEQRQRAALASGVSPGNSAAYKDCLFFRSFFAAPPNACPSVCARSSVMSLS